MISNTTKGYIMILLSALGFGSYGVWSKLIGDNFGIFFQAWVRAGIIVLILFPIGYFTKSFKKIKKEDIKRFSLPIIFGIFTMVPLYYAFNNAGIGISTLIFYAMFIITTYIVGKFLMKEDITKIKLLSLILSFFGLVLMFGLSFTKFSILALGLAALNGIASGGEVATTKKVTNKYSSIQISVYLWLVIMLTHLPISILLGENQVPFAFNTIWFSMIAFAVIGLISFWLVIEGFKYVDASIGGLIGLMEIIFGIIFGILLFTEQLSLSVIVGGGIILLAAMLPDLSEIIKKKISPSQNP